jgi:hypothetical protein
MKQGKFPRGWNEQRVRRVLAHYEEQSQTEAVAEDEASFEGVTQTVMEVPKELVPAVRQLIAKRRAQTGRTPIRPPLSRGRKGPVTGAGARRVGSGTARESENSD